MSSLSAFGLVDHHNKAFSFFAEVEVKAKGAPTKGPTKTAKLSDFLDGHSYPKAQESLTVLDMYAGCGGMSTGLGHGLGKAGVTLHHVSCWRSCLVQSCF